jgi:hypothetical protein
VSAHHSLKVPSARSSKLPAPSPPSGTALRIPLGGGSLPLPCDRYGRTLTCGVLVRVAICERQQEGGTEPGGGNGVNSATGQHAPCQCICSSAVQCALRSMVHVHATCGVWCMCTRPAEYGACARDLRSMVHVHATCGGHSKCNVEIKQTCGTPRVNDHASRTVDTLSGSEYSVHCCLCHITSLALDGGDGPFLNTRAPSAALSRALLMARASCAVSLSASVDVDTVMTSAPNAIDRSRRVGHQASHDPCRAMFYSRSVQGLDQSCKLFGVKTKVTSMLLEVLRVHGTQRSWGLYGRGT